MDQVENKAGPATRPSPVRVKKLGHIVLQVRDIERSVKFYTEVLNFRVSDRQDTGGTFLTGIGDHHTIGLFPSDGPNAEQPSHGAVRLHHFALQVDNMDELFAIREWLKERGIPIEFEGRRRLGGHTSVEFPDPDGYLVELFCDMDQLEPGQRSRPMAPGPQLKSLEASRANPKPPTW
ncbi:MAG: VOC family protein [Burkholderiales bacterium]|nr:VOC family protein [Burkholderiales bacterium]